MILIRPDGLQFEATEFYGGLSGGTPAALVKSPWMVGSNPFLYLLLNLDPYIG